MKAAVYHGPDTKLSIEEVPTPEPDEHGLLVRVRACGVCGSDLHASQHGFPEPGGILGHEFAGDVVGMGTGATGEWSEGDRVFSLPQMTCGECPACLREDSEMCAHIRALGALQPGDLPGAYAEFVAVSARDSLRLPADLEYSQAALIEPMATGLKAVREGRLPPRGNVLVIGAGPIGLAITHWARFFGTGRVVVSERAAGRIELATALGATDVIDANGVDDPVAEFRRIAGRPPDVIFEAVGVSGMIQRCIEIAPRRGLVVVAGVCMEADTIQPVLAILKEIRLSFVLGYSIDDCRFTLEMMSAGRIDPRAMITDHVSLDALPDAFEALRRPTHQCKVMVTR
jgi:(R,R)-butanediol dehydrogenase/meso-butanediol dehydrogenase/diacetyl reductase